MMTTGFYLIVKPLATILSIVSFLGDLTSWALLIVCALLSCVLSGATMGTAWFFYRPIVALGLLGAALVVWYVGMKYLHPIMHPMDHHRAFPMQLPES